VAAIQEIALRLRDDVASEPNQREANQQNAPAVENGLFLVPKVIE
jgi:aspartyl-tRNA(Asn)/glutamyl-tRNA(Gln) amidotransferase subunit C